MLAIQIRHHPSTGDNFKAPVTLVRSRQPDTAIHPAAHLTQRIHSVPTTTVGSLNHPPAPGSTMLVVVVFPCIPGYGNPVLQPHLVCQCTRH